MNKFRDISHALADNPAALMDEGKQYIDIDLTVGDPSGEIISTLLPADVPAKLNVSLADFDKARRIYTSRTANSI